VLRPAVLRTAIASLARGQALFFRAIRWKELDTYFRRAVLVCPESAPRSDAMWSL